MHQAKSEYHYLMPIRLKKPLQYAQNLNLCNLQIVSMAYIQCSI